MAQDAAENTPERGLEIGYPPVDVARHIDRGVLRQVPEDRHRVLELVRERGEARRRRAVAHARALRPALRRRELQRGRRGAPERGRTPAAEVGRGRVVRERAPRVARRDARRDRRVVLAPPVAARDVRVLVRGRHGVQRRVRRVGQLRLDGVEREAVVRVAARRARAAVVACGAARRPAEPDRAPVVVVAAVAEAVGAVYPAWMGLA